MYRNRGLVISELMTASITVPKGKFCAVGFLSLNDRNQMYFNWCAEMKFVKILSISISFVRVHIKFIERSK